MKKLKSIVTDVVDKVICDKCNQEVDNDIYDAFKFDLTYKKGECYPDGGSGVKVDIDLCPKCAEDLISLLENNNYRTNTSDWDY